MSAGCFSLVAGMAPAEQNGGDFIGYGTFVFIDNSENIIWPLYLTFTVLGKVSYR